MVTEPRVPNVIGMDSDGRPVSVHETVAVALSAKTVETVPWNAWAEKQAKRSPHNATKLFLLTTIDYVHQSWSIPCPIARLGKGSASQALATAALRVGALVVPLLAPKPSSVGTEDEGATLHPKAVAAVVSWSTPMTAVVKFEDTAGSGYVEVRLRVQPEL